jgi:hypothetical protein
LESENVSQGLLYLAIAGLPVVIAFAWFFQITPEGVVRTNAFVDRRVLNNIEPLNDKRHESVTTYFRDEEELTHRWVITAETGTLKGLSYGISQPVIIGRLKQCDITLPSAHISRNHARLYLEDGLLMIEDLGSSNGSIVNGRALEEKQSIHHKDELLFHDVLFRVSENYALQNGDPDASLRTTSFKPTKESRQ